jgi:hypothetical protein
MHGTSQYTKYSQCGSLLMGSLYPFVGASFCVYSTIVGFACHLASLPRIHTHVHVVCTQSQLALCLCPHASLPESTPNPHLKKEILLGFGFELIMIRELDPCL